MSVLLYRMFKHSGSGTVNESRVSVLDELSCSAIDISASTSSSRLAGVIGSRLAWPTHDSSPQRVTDHSQDSAGVERDIGTLGGLFSKLN